ncbi:M48 family metallopeptidase [Vannielia litorea]|uniref:M48 family metallopeptidase n=1 Tax=Vannielia litorea TaxID=1217970 RepID=UPI001C940B19|nr:M48 family metallopeptidase [Vannielia litorea]MBY6155255.1 M48 family metallopeptidase [Vannielia litorea]
MADPTPPLPTFAVAGRFFDGQSAGAKVVRAEAEQIKGRLLIYDEESGRLLDQWPLDSLRMIRDPGFGDGIVFFREGHDEARLNIASAEDAAALGAVAPNLRKVSVAKGTWRKVLLWSGGAVAALLLILFVILPTLADTLAGMIDPEQEERIGQTVVGQVERMLGSHNGSGFCSTPEGDAALAKMTERFTDHLDLPYELKVRVIRNPLVNAFAAPGGHVVIVSGLLDKADSPEEVAGVLAHEIGHVAARDPLRITLRTAGSAGIISMILGDFAGGALVILVSEQLMQASYTRDAEAGADEFAHELLRKAELPSEGMARFFEKLRDQYGDVDGAEEFLSSHPNLASRAIAAREAETRGDGTFVPVLDDAEWDALRAICK